MWADLVPSFGPAERHALLLSTLAGASTTVGAAVAVREKKRERERREIGEGGVF